MWTKKGKYGLKAILHLAGLPAGETTLIADIAEAEDIPRKFLEAILVDLKNAGFVTSKKGKGGGYMLARPASEIIVGHVIRTIDGPLAPLACASRTRYQRCEDCPDEATCAVRLTTIDVRNAISSVLDATTLEQMYHRAAGDTQVLMYHI
jgi:Rrf2 family protein